MGQEDISGSMHPHVCTHREKSFRKEAVMGKAHEVLVMCFSSLNRCFEPGSVCKDMLVFIPYFTDPEEELPVFQDCAVVDGCRCTNDFF